MLETGSDEISARASASGRRLSAGPSISSRCSARSSSAPVTAARDRATDELDQLVGRPATVEERQEPGQEHLSCRSGEPDDGSGVLEQNRILERCEPVPRFQERPLRDGEGDHRSGAERHARAAGAAAAADVDVEREERVARSSGLRGELEQLCGQSVEHVLVLSHRGLPGQGLAWSGLAGRRLREAGLFEHADRDGSIRRSFATDLCRISARPNKPVLMSRITLAGILEP